jgi:hypothetical protein
MRLILATAAAALVVSVATSTAVFAQKKNAATARASVNNSYNRCVSLAKARGFARSDISGPDTPARNFVTRCMQGKQN